MKNKYKQGDIIAYKMPHVESIRIGIITLQYPSEYPMYKTLICGQPHIYDKVYGDEITGVIYEQRN